MYIIYIYRSKCSFRLDLLDGCRAKELVQEPVSPFAGDLLDDCRWKSLYWNKFPFWLDRIG